MPAYRQESNPYDTIRLLHRRLTTRPDDLRFPMIQTLEAEIDETGSVRFNHPVHLDRPRDTITCSSSNNNNSSSSKRRGCSSTSRWSSTSKELPVW